MESEGLIRTMAYFCDMEVEIGTVVTDHHVQVIKWVRENMPNTRHEFDVWHVAKGISSCLFIN
jgi:solute carrier family 8 (sodium/calcium exchanger)